MADYVYIIMLLKTRIFGTMLTIIWLQNAFGVASIRFSMESRKVVCFEKNQIIQFAIPDVPIYNRCTVLKHVLLNPVQQNRMFRYF
jgi:hypothetical protein